MALQPGTPFGNYEVIAPLGAGGMGEVYKAKDTRLGRLVALKALPAGKVADPHRRQRFLQEARAASALNHPNIITIYDWIEDEGNYVLVMEHVPGQSLAQMISRKGLPLHDVLKYSAQIADALAAAHAAGIIHRDIKPGNIMVTEQGRVKVLDFGLAKLQDPPEPDEATLTSAPLTQEGMVAGSAPYMSPEQAQGKKVDARSDIFSFGAVLYEMVTGQRAFPGATAAASMAAVIKSDPKPASQLAEDLPKELDRILTRCLRKDLDRRSQSIAEIKIELDEIREESESGALAATPSPAKSRKRNWALTAAGIAVILAVIGAWAWRSRPAADAPAPMSLRQLTADSGLTTSPALSRDGKLVAYASDRATQKNLDIWVHPLAEGAQPIRLTSHDAEDFAPDFSPDGGLIAFQSSRDGGGIYLVPATGGEERLLVQAGQRPRFSPDGKFVAYCVLCGLLRDSKIFMIPVAGGAAIPLAADVPWATAPVFSPDGKNVLFEGASAANNSEDRDLWVTPVQGGRSIKTGFYQAHSLDNFLGVRSRDWLDGRIRFLKADQVWEAGISSADWRPSGPARQLTSVAGTVNAARTVGNYTVLSAGQGFSHLWKLKLDMNQGRVLGEAEPLPHPGGSQFEPSASADGKVLAYSQVEPGGESVRTRDLATGKENTILSFRARPKVSPDGSRIAYYDYAAGKGIYLVSSTGGAAELLWQPPGKSGASVYNWSPDGAKLVYWTGNPISWFLLDPNTRQSTPLMSHPSLNLHDLELSPDQRWAAFATQTGRTNPLWIAPVREGRVAGDKDWIPLVRDSAYIPRWSPDGNLLYMINPRDGNSCIWAQRLDASTKRPKGDGFAVYHMHGGRHGIRGGQFYGPAILPDGIIFSATEQTGNVWLGELK